jgi:hypothetical protein
MICNLTNGGESLKLFILPLTIALVSMTFVFTASANEANYSSETSSAAELVQSVVGTEVANACSPTGAYCNYSNNCCGYCFQLSLNNGVCCTSEPTSRAEIETLCRSR